MFCIIPSSPCKSLQTLASHCFAGNKASQVESGKISIEKMLLGTV